MSTEQDQARLLAERIARRVSGGQTGSRASRSEGGSDVGHELSVMRATLEELQLRLARIESHVTHNANDTFQSERDSESREQGSAQQQTRQSMGAQGGSRSPWLSGVYFSAT